MGLARITLNLGGPGFKKKRVIYSATMYIILYGSQIWKSVYKTNIKRRRWKVLQENVLKNNISLQNRPHNGYTSLVIANKPLDRRTNGYIRAGSRAQSND